MENILLGIILSSLILQTLLVRHFLKQLLHKLSNEISFAKSNSTISSVIPSQLDKPSKNLVMENENTEIEFSEDYPLTVPPDVKFEVEGGDINIPPGFSVKN